MSDKEPRGRLFRKYVVVLLVLVGGVLMASSLVELYFSYQEHKAALVSLQREKALAEPLLGTVITAMLLAKARRRLGRRVVLSW